LRGGARYNSIIGVNPCGFIGWIFLLIHLAVSAWVSFRIANYIIE